MYWIFYPANFRKKPLAAGKNQNKRQKLFGAQLKRLQLGARDNKVVSLPDY